MAFLSGLLSIGCILYLTGILFRIPVLQNLHTDARIAAAVMFILIGFFHLAKPEKLTYMIDGMLPFAQALVIITGVLEVLLGICLLIPSLQVPAAWALIILLILMFPANIRVAVLHLPAPGGLPAQAWYTWSRLLFQPVYIWWIWWAVIKIMN
ncbi:DoxX family membrane protein [Chitinophaga sp. Mgbs1]|uniref:DoxX family membrane protein n=1 Tax=Chitinophaga solisilvae TaxID=1233460 RepID=A0A3S1CP31_9BACT|nr:DoxX family membrane protein [Chitinophaga solisilvae]